MARTRGGFTLVELMVVVLIVGVLAAVAMSLMRGHGDASKWSEAKTSMGMITSALRAYAIEKGNFSAAPTLGELRICESDLDGTYFSHEAYAITSASAVDGRVSFVVTCKAADSTRDGAPTSPPIVTLTCNADNDYVPTFSQQGD